ncbi:MAG: DNA-3-methyladenine glycosylase 2 family protein [Pseudomonadota bacterium]
MTEISTQHDLDTAAVDLARCDPRFGPILAQTGPLPLRRAAGGFAGVLKIMMGQQVSTASAAAIWYRVRTAGLDNAAAWNNIADAQVLELGLSRPKLRYARALCDAAIPFDDLPNLSDAQVAGHLTAVTGVGPWTADIYLLSCLGRPDVFPTADLALQESARVAFDLPTRPDAKHMAVLAAPWAPWRSVAARALWSYYRIAKGKEGLA